MRDKKIDKMLTDLRSAFEDLEYESMAEAMRTPGQGEGTWVCPKCYKQSMAPPKEPLFPPPTPAAIKSVCSKCYKEKCICCKPKYTVKGHHDSKGFVMSTDGSGIEVCEICWEEKCICRGYWKNGVFYENGKLRDKDIDDARKAISKTISSKTISPEEWYSTKKPEFIDHAVSVDNKTGTQESYRQAYEEEKEAVKGND